MQVDKYSLLAFYQLLFTLITVCKSEKLSASECKQLGYSSDELLCSTCDELTNFKLNDLEKSCKKCCIADREEPKTRKFARAVLEVCSWKLGRYPQVQAFIKSDLPSKYPNLEIKYTRGSDPTLVLFDELDDEVENLGIDKWTTDTVEEYLNQILV
jgi:hypothetical protein